MKWINEFQEKGKGIDRLGLSGNSTTGGSVSIIVQ
jgi:hypothetical protein